MAGLALKLAPKEQVLINGVVVENGPRRAQLLIKTDNAAVLRLRDALDEADVIGPASEAYFAVQRGVAGELSLSEAEAELEPLLTSLAGAESGEDGTSAIELARKGLVDGNLYRVMRALRPLVDQERDAPEI